MPNPHSANWRLPAAAGVLTLAFSVHLNTVFPEQNLGFPAGYGAPVLAFEFARTPADLQAVFGPPEAPDRALLTAMDAGNWLDYGFMLLYGSFLFLFHRAVAPAGRAVAAWLGPFAAGCDAIENAILLGISADLAAASGLPWLRIWVVAKFAALAASAWWGGRALMRMEHRRLQVGGAAAMVGALVAVGALAVPHRFGPGLILGIGLAWVVFTLVAVRGGASRSSWG